MSQWLPAKVISRKDWNSHLFSLVLECDRFPRYQAGQFIKLSALLNERRITRAYSLVSAPREQHLEVLVVKVDDGQFTPYLHSLAVGDTLDVSESARGDFTLEKIPEKNNLWLIATGTGVSPFLSMLTEGELWRRKGRVFLIYGVRYLDDLAYYERIRHWLAAYSRNFCFIPVVSREIPDYGIYGRLTALLGNQRLEKVCGAQINAQSDSVMLCGNPKMIEDATTILESVGLQKYRPSKGGSIHTERYW